MANQHFGMENIFKIDNVLCMIVSQLLEGARPCCPKVYAYGMQVDTYVSKHVGGRVINYYA